jgi:hypothetical protein
MGQENLEKFRHKEKVPRKSKRFFKFRQIPKTKAKRRE